MNHPFSFAVDMEEGKVKLNEINTRVHNHLLNAEKEENKLLNNTQKDPGSFYRHINKSKCQQFIIGPLRCGARYDSDPKRMAEILSKH